MVPAATPAAASGTALEAPNDGTCVVRGQPGQPGSFITQQRGAVTSACPDMVGWTKREMLQGWRHNRQDNIARTAAGARVEVVGSSKLLRCRNTAAGSQQYVYLAQSAGPSAPKVLTVVPAVIPPFAAVIAVVLWVMSVRSRQNSGHPRKSTKNKVDQDHVVAEQQLKPRACDAEEATALSRSAAGNITLSSLVIRQGWQSIDGNNNISGSAELERLSCAGLQHPEGPAGDDDVQAVHQGEIRPGSVPGGIVTRPKVILWPAMTEAAASGVLLEDPCKVESPKPATPQKVPRLRWVPPPSSEPSTKAVKIPRLQCNPPLTEPSGRVRHTPPESPLAAAAAAFSHAWHHR
eukprot:gene12932-13060_t